MPVPRSGALTEVVATVEFERVCGTPALPTEPPVVPNELAS